MARKPPSHAFRRMVRNLSSDDPQVSGRALVRLAEMADDSPRLCLKAMRIVAGTTQLKCIRLRPLTSVPMAEVVIFDALPHFCEMNAYCIGILLGLATRHFGDGKLDEFERNGWNHVVHQVLNEGWSDGSREAREQIISFLEQFNFTDTFIKFPREFSAAFEPPFRLDTGRGFASAQRTPLLRILPVLLQLIDLYTVTGGVFPFSRGVIKRCIAEESVDSDRYATLAFELAECAEKERRQSGLTLLGIVCEFRPEVSERAVNLLLQNLTRTTEKFTRQLAAKSLLQIAQSLKKRGTADDLALGERIARDLSRLKLLERDEVIQRNFARTRKLFGLRRCPA